MTIAIKMGNFPPLEIEDATDEQIIQVFKFVESMQEDEADELIRNPFSEKSSFKPRLEVSE